MYKFGPSAQGWRESNVLVFGASGLQACQVAYPIDMPVQLQTTPSNQFVVQYRSLNSMPPCAQYEEGCCSEVSEDEECGDVDEEEEEDSEGGDTDGGGKNSPRFLCVHETPLQRIMLLDPTER